MIPLRARRRPTGLAFVTWTMMAACTAVLARLALLPDARAVAIFDALAVVPARLVAHPTDPGQLLTLFTSAFLHAGWVHLIGNLVFLWVFGPVVEDGLGHVRFAALYLSSGVAGALAFVALTPTSTTPLVGASAAIAGVLGAALVVDPRAEITTLVPIVVWFELAELPTAFVVGLWFLLQVASALAPVVVEAGTAVAWSAHIAGFAFGALACLLAVATGGRSIKARTRRALPWSR